jgi:hypothetical protein
MKEERHYLDTLQVVFLQKMMHKIAQGKWSTYGDSTVSVLSTIIQFTYYTDSQKEWLLSMREDYLNTFCR